MAVVNDARDARNDKTAPRRPRSKASLRSGSYKPALTILWHHDTSRIGEVAVLSDPLREEGRVGVTRLTPSFHRPGTDATPQPLLDGFLSRTSPDLEIVASDDGLLELRPGVLDEPTEVDGIPLTRSIVLGSEQIARGAVVLIAREIVLCLHHADDFPGPAEDLGMIGFSHRIQRVRAAIRQAARSTVPVLIRGETGTGKELVARAIVAQGPRAKKPFIAVNMGGVVPSTAAAELFGHERGAFTGAVSDRLGYFAAAEGGTLFLDEIGATPPDVQAMLLRALDGGEILSLGRDKSRRVDVRILAATDANLEEAIASRLFSRPLCERISGFQIDVPRLRDRREDFGRLFFHFLRQEMEATQQAQSLSPPQAGALPWMSAGRFADLAMGKWPGNVRGLRNAAHRIAVASIDQARAVIDDVVERMAEPPGWTPEKVRSEPPSAQPRRKTSNLEQQEIKPEQLVEVLRAHSWSPSRAAIALGVPRSTLSNLIERHPEIQKATSITVEEIRREYDLCKGDLKLMAARLKISKRSLQLRLATVRTHR